MYCEYRCYVFMYRVLVKFGVVFIYRVLVKIDVMDLYTWFLVNFN